MSKLTLALLAITMLFIGMFSYVSIADTQTTQEGITLLLIFSDFFAVTFTISGIFDMVAARKRVRFSKRNGFYTILVLVCISFSSCTSKSKQHFDKLAQEQVEIDAEIMKYPPLLADAVYNGPILSSMISMTGSTNFSVEKEPTVSFLVWVNHEGGIFLSFDEVLPLDKILALKEKYNYGNFDSYLIVDRDEVSKTKMCLGIAERNVLIEIQDVLKNMESIFPLVIDTELWKDVELPKRKSTITIK